MKQEGWESQDEENVLFMGQSPWSALYHEGNLKSLSTVHQFGPDTAKKLEDSMWVILNW